MAPRGPCKPRHTHSNHVHFLHHLQLFLPQLLLLKNPIICGISLILSTELVHSPCALQNKDAFIVQRTLRPSLLLCVFHSSSGVPFIYTFHSFSLSHSGLAHCFQRVNDWFTSQEAYIFLSILSTCSSVLGCTFFEHSSTFAFAFCF